VTVRVLYVDHADLLGGAEQCLLLLLRGLDRRRYAPLLACNEDSPLRQAAAEAGVPVHTIEMGRLRGRRNPFSLLGVWARGVAGLRRLIRAQRVDIVHSNTLRASLYAAPAARLTPAALVWHVHDIHRERLYAWAMARLADRIIAVSQATARPLPPASWRKLRVIPNGVDLERFAPNPAWRQATRAAWGASDDEIWIGAMSWLAPWKQTELFLEMAERLSARAPNCRFVVVGGEAHPSHAEYVAGLRRRAAATLGERCLFLGPRTDAPQVLAGLDILAHTSRAEPFGRVLIEAMALEKPVVAFADGGAPEIIIEGETGRLIPPGDTARMAEAVAELAGDAALRRRMGQAGRRRALAEYSAAAMAQRVQDVYEGLA